jgi:hypothetical protein
VNQDSNFAAEQQSAREPAGRRVLQLQMSALILLAFIFPVVTDLTHDFFKDYARIPRAIEIIMICPKAAMAIGSLWLAIVIMIGCLRMKASPLKDKY